MPRGRRQARAVGEHLAGLGVVPSTALVSTAVRTRQTWDEVAGAAGCDVTPRLDDDLYGGGPESVLEVLRTVEADASTVVVVGHNPTIGYLAQMIDDGEGDPAAFTSLGEGYPTGSLAVFGVESEWSGMDVDNASARLLDFFTG